MDFPVVRVGNASVITISGELDGDNAYQLYLTASREAEDGSAQVVFDLRGVTFVDSVGLGMLVRSRDELTRLYESALVLRDPSERVVALLELTALDSQFRIERS